MNLPLKNKNEKIIENKLVSNISSADTEEEQETSKSSKDKRIVLNKLDEADANSHNEIATFDFASVNPNMNFYSARKKIISDVKILGNFLQKNITTNDPQMKESTSSLQNKGANNLEYYDVDHPFDEYQFALNISEGCDVNNCAFPNNCINQTTCACGDFHANFFASNSDNERTKINYTSNQVQNDNNNNNKKIYCAYERKNQVTLSILEVFLPGIGFFHTGFYAYGIVKFFICCMLFLIIGLKLGRCFKKDRLPGYDESYFCAEYTRDFHFYLMIASYILIVLWMAIDLSLISFRVWKDPNGVNFQLRQIYNKYDQ